MAQELGPNQRKWVEALRGGQYEQGTGFLCRNDHYCCLGVACLLYSVYVEEKEGIKFWNGRDSSADTTTRSALALRSSLGSSRDFGPGLSSLNDGGKTFAEIADLIEADPANWFTEAK